MRKQSLLFTTKTSQSQTRSAYIYSHPFHSCLFFQSPLPRRALPRVSLGDDWATVAAVCSSPSPTTFTTRYGRHFPLPLCETEHPNPNLKPFGYLMPTNIWPMSLYWVRHRWQDAKALGASEPRGVPIPRWIHLDSHEGREPQALPGYWGYFVWELRQP